MFTARQIKKAKKIYKRDYVAYDIKPSDIRTFGKEVLIIKQLLVDIKRILGADKLD